MDAPTADGAAMVCVRALTKTYPPQTRAVDGIDLTVREGEVFGLLGPNGAGKSTTLKMLVTLETPTSGEAHVCGFDVMREPDAVRRSLGYVGQEVAVDKLLTARENLTLFGELYHLCAADVRERTEALLTLVELTDRAGEPVKGFSGGMKKRLDIACGLVHNPRLLVLDEPTLGLDIQTRRHIWQEIESLRAGGTTVIITTHYLEEADKICDRLAIIDDGKIQAVGTPAQLKSEVGGECLTLTMAQADEARMADFGERVRTLPFTMDLVKGETALDVYVRHADEAIVRVLELAHTVGLPVKALTLTQPSLDDVFLKHTGHRMREE